MLNEATRGPCMGGRKRICTITIGILHEGSIQTWLLPEGLAKIMPEPEGWGHYFCQARGQ